MANDSNLCPTCRKAQCAGFVGGQFYVNCLDCVEANAAKRRVRRQVKLRKLAAAVKEAGTK